MAVIFLVLALVSAFHFIYESTILPSLRLKNRIRLFALRDKLRRLKIQQPDLDEQAYAYVQETINGFAKYLSVVDVAFIIATAQMVENDPAVKERVEKRIAKIENANSPELKAIVSEVHSIIKDTALANNGMWFLYLTPLVMLLSGITSFLKSLRVTTCVPQRELDKMPLGECIPQAA